MYVITLYEIIKKILFEIKGLFLGIKRDLRENITGHFIAGGGNGRSLKFLLKNTLKEAALYLKSL